MTKCEIRPVTFAAILDAPNSEALLAEYARECSIPEIGEFNPQRAMYAAMEASGGFKVFGVFHMEQIIGFFALLIYVLPHYGQRIATTESIFLALAHRRAPVWQQMRKFIREYAKEQGCRTVLLTAPAESRFEKLLMLDEDCRRSNSVFVWSL